MRKIITLLAMLTLSALFALSASAQNGHDDHDGHDHDDEHGHAKEGFVLLSPEELKEFAITVASAGPGILESSLELSGEVHANSDRLAHIVPRYSGIATEVRVKIGDYVKKGQVLAVLESDQSLAPFQVKTLISGTVIGKHITLGEAASRDRDTFVIADLSSVWIDLTVYQRDLDQVRVGEEVEIFVGHDREDQKGTISYIAPILDEHTRTATARVVLSNKTKRWRPGMFVTAHVLVERAEVAVAVPKTALFSMEEKTVVFMETPDGFKPQPVQVGRQSRTHVEILSGLSLGERYASEGGFTIRAELGKASFGDGHAH